MYHGSTVYNNDDVTLAPTLQVIGDHDALNCRRTPNLTSSKLHRDTYVEAVAGG